MWTLHHEGYPVLDVHGAKSTCTTAPLWLTRNGCLPKFCRSIGISVLTDFTYRLRGERENAKLSL